MARDRAPRRPRIRLPTSCPLPRRGAHDDLNPSPIVIPLTPKESEVLGYLAELLTTEEIAATMFVSVNTIRSHVRSILRKLGVGRRNEAVRLAWELRLLPTPGSHPHHHRPMTRAGPSVITLRTSGAQRVGRRGSGSCRRNGTSFSVGIAARPSTARPVRMHGPGHRARGIPRPILGAGPSADQALSEFAETYADRNDRDHEAFEEAAKTGRIEVVRGV